MSRGKRGVLERSTCPTESRAGPGQGRGDKRTQRPLPLERFPPGQRGGLSCSPDTSEDVLFCSPSSCRKQHHAGHQILGKLWCSTGPTADAGAAPSHRCKNLKMESGLEHAEGAKIREEIHPTEDEEGRRETCRWVRDNADVLMYLNHTHKCSGRLLNGADSGRRRPSADATTTCAGGEDEKQTMEGITQAATGILSHIKPLPTHNPLS